MMDSNHPHMPRRTYSNLLPTKVIRHTISLYLTCPGRTRNAVIDSNNLVKRVEQTGFEPAYILVANQAFSQLNYCPICNLS